MRAFGGPCGGSQDERILHSAESQMVPWHHGGGTQKVPHSHGSGTQEVLQCHGGSTQKVSQPHDGGTQVPRGGSQEVPKGYGGEGSREDPWYSANLWITVQDPHILLT